MHSSINVGGRRRVPVEEMKKPRYRRGLRQLGKGELAVGERVMNDFSAFSLAPDDVSYIARD